MNNKEKFKKAKEALKPPKLRPCPFCGGKAEICEVPDMGGWVVGHEVRCSECNTSTRSYSTDIAYIEYAENAFCSTDKLLACRAWNGRPKKGTMSCPKCGIAVPHKHEKYEPNNKYSETILVVLICK